MGRVDRYSLAAVVWVAITIGGAVALLTGVSEPYLAVSQIPGEHEGVIGGAIVSFVVGTIFVNVGRGRAWTRAGKGAGLTPEGGGLFGGHPEFTGDVRGRPVRVHSYTRQKGYGDGNSKYSYTVVETELSTPIEDGAVVGIETSDDGMLSGGVFSGSAATVTDDATFSVVGDGSESVPRDVLSRAPLDALSQLERFGTLTIGDATGIVGGSPLESENATVDNLTDDNLGKELSSGGQMGPTTVSHTTATLLLDGDELRRQAEAVTAIADAVESGRTDRPT